jgi:hypothetical protein
VLGDSPPPSHLEAVTDKAERFLGAIRCLLPNVNGPKDAVRRIYYGVWESVVLYGAPIWASSLGREINKKIIKRAQRAALIRMSTAYRTYQFTSRHGCGGSSMALRGSLAKTWR